MSDQEQTQERAADGLLGKAAGRVKQFVGSTLGNPQLDHEGRLQQVQAEAGEEAIERGQEADEKDAEVRLAIAKAETETERREAAVLEREANRAERVAGAGDPEQVR